MLSCASAFGPEWVQHARDAAAWFAKRQPDEDAKVTLLRDIRSVFNACHADRISSKALAAELAALYHERWEIETAFDELKTHLRGAHYRAAQ